MRGIRHESGMRGKRHYQKLGTGHQVKRDSRGQAGSNIGDQAKRDSQGQAGSSTGEETTRGNQGQVGNRRLINEEQSGSE